MNLREAFSKVTRDFWVRAVLAAIIIELLLFGIVLGVGMKLERPSDLAVFATVPLFVITLIELRRTLNVQRADLIKGLVSEFFLKPELYATFHDLIYTFHDDIFDQMEILKRDGHLESSTKPVFGPFENLQNGRKEGARFYHPDLFQRSPEEKRLDVLLGYLDVIGYYHRRGLIPIEDIVGSLGYYLEVMQRRKAVMSYLEGNRSAWETPQYRESYGPVPPFAYLHRLLREVRKFNNAWGERQKQQIYQNI